jgi:hypothetical protein
MHRSCTVGLLAGTIGLIGVTHAAGQQQCRPNLAIKDVQFSEMQRPTLERKWTAVVSVDASRCAMNSSGNFEIGFLRLKETAPDFEFAQAFAWSPPSVKIALNFSADEAVGRYWISHVSGCVCAK